MVRSFLVVSFLVFGLGCPNSGFSILCNDYAIKLVEAPFVSDADDQDEWAL